MELKCVPCDPGSAVRGSVDGMLADGGSDREHHENRGPEVGEISRGHHARAPRIRTQSKYTPTPATIITIPRPANPHPLVAKMYNHPASAIADGSGYAHIRNGSTKPFR